MNETQIKSLISLTNFKSYAKEVFDSPLNTLDMMQRIAEDCKVCMELQADLYENGCFNNAELMAEFEKTETQIQLYKLILAELPKYI